VRAASAAEGNPVLQSRAGGDRSVQAEKLRIAFASPLKDLPAELLDRPEARKNFKWLTQKGDGKLGLSGLILVSLHALSVR
jgi:hypothetical protein